MVVFQSSSEILSENLSLWQRELKQFRGSWKLCVLGVFRLLERKLLASTRVEVFQRMFGDSLDDGKGERGLRQLRSTTDLDRYLGVAP